MRRMGHQVMGFLERDDARMIVRLVIRQRPEGDMLEVGALYGRSAILLGYLLGQGESLIVCDPFESHLRGGLWPGLSRTAFEENYLRYHKQLPDVRQCRSSEISVVPGSMSLIHLDGDHLLDAAQADVDRAIPWLAKGGLLVVNDFDLDARGLAEVARSTTKVAYRV